MKLTAGKLKSFLHNVPPETPIIMLAHTDSGLAFIGQPEIRTRESIVNDEFLGQHGLDSLEEGETEKHNLFVFID